MRTERNRGGCFFLKEIGRLREAPEHLWKERNERRIRIIGWRMEGGRTEIIRLREAPEHLWKERNERRIKIIRLAQLEWLITKNYSNYANFFQTKSRLITKNYSNYANFFQTKSRLITKNYSNYANFFQTKSRLITKNYSNSSHIVYI